MEMSHLRQVLQRVNKSIPNCLYNRRLVDIYLLASHGLIVTEKHNQSSNPQQSFKKKQFIAKCQNLQCGLVIELDDYDKMPEIKNQLELQIIDHDVECPFKKIESNIINFELFQQLGHQIYKENRENIRKNQKYIQLSPEQIKETLDIKNQFSFSKKQKMNLRLEMFKKIDKHLQNNQLMKVSSSIFLAIFGWKFSDREQNTVFCQFCNKSKNIFEYISPSQCTLMNLPFGFKFISEHQPWCCLISSQNSFWKDILRQVVIKQLKSKQGKVSKTSSQIKCRQIKANLISIYTNHYSGLMNLNKKIQEFKSLIDRKYGSDNHEIKESFESSCSSLQRHLVQGQEIFETFIKKIKLNQYNE